MSTCSRLFGLPLLLALPLYCLGAHAQDTSSLQQRMSSTEFRAAGLDKLSPQELANLDNWLSAHGNTTKVVDTSGKPVFYADSAKRQKINAHMTGHFGGWQSRSQFTLDNGQVWKQVGSDMPECMTSDNPAVKVKPTLFGGWLMFVDGCNGDSHVERVR